MDDDNKTEARAYVDWAAERRARAHLTDSNDIRDIDRAFEERQARRRRERQTQRAPGLWRLWLVLFIFALIGLLIVFGPHLLIPPPPLPLS